MSTDSAASLGIVRAILDSAAISDSDRLSFFENVGAAVGSAGADLSVGPERRKLWARALITIASALLAPDPPVLPQHGTDSEMMTAELTRSEFEVWDSQLKPKSVSYGDHVGIDTVSATQQGDLDKDIDFDAPESPAKEEEDGAAKPSEEEDENGEEEPANGDGFDDFIVDRIEEIR
jgi:hypothetical protein